MMEQWNDGILGSGLRPGEDIGMAVLENQNEYNCIDFLVIEALSKDFLDSVDDIFPNGESRCGRRGRCVADMEGSFGVDK